MYTPEKCDTPLCSPSFFPFFFVTPFFDHWEKNGHTILLLEVNLVCTHLY